MALLSLGLVLGLADPCFWIKTMILEYFYTAAIDNIPHMYYILVYITVTMLDIDRMYIQMSLTLKILHSFL